MGDKNYDATELHVTEQINNAISNAISASLSTLLWLSHMPLMVHASQDYRRELDGLFGGIPTFVIRSPRVVARTQRQDMSTGEHLGKSFFFS